MAIPVPAKYIADFEEMGFGMFVHWGLYSQLGMGEWTYYIHKRDKEEYMKLKDTFTAEDFDAEKLVLTAKAAGCKYITLTTRHHEGFSLYDTCGLSDFDAPHSPAGRDLIREFVDACNKYDIVPFFYHTTLDWINEDYENDFDTYLEYLRKSVETLCTNYGKIGGLWFDGNWDKPDSDWKEAELYATIRKHQPEAIIVNNTGLHRRGEVGEPEIDSVTFEQGRPTPMDREGMPKYLAAETCLTMNDHWGYGYLDLDYKSPRELIELLCDCRRVGANLLLNIGPKAQGEIDALQAEILKAVGRWMDIYGEAVYKGKPYQSKGMGKNFILRNGNELYLFFYELARIGSTNVTVGGNYYGAYAFGQVADEIESIEWMDNGEKLNFCQSGDLLSVDATGFPYGMSCVVRVARAKIKG
ncbi:MAG: alpha-L-fucosidase [Clostridia bacterium]|nr:alpha-L-fucosidase [Clostridia bacterium]